MTILFQRTSPSLKSCSLRLVDKEPIAAALVAARHLSTVMTNLLLERFIALKDKIDSVIAGHNEVVGMSVENHGVNVVESSYNVKEMIPKGSDNDPHILSTNRPY